MAITSQRSTDGRTTTHNLGISRAFHVLELLAAEPRSLRITDLASALRLNKAIAFRLVSSLIDAGYVRQDPETQRYQATFKLAALGLQKLEQSGVGEWAQEPLDWLAEQTRELVRLAVIEDHSLRWIAKAQGSNSRLIIDPAAGADVVLHATATGKAWLSTMPPEQARQTLEVRGLDPRTPHTITEIETVMAEIEEARRRGYAIVLEEMDPGVNAIAAPIYVPVDGTSPVGTVSVAGPSVRLTQEMLEHLAGPLLETARELAARWSIYRHQLTVR